MIVIGVDVHKRTHTLVALDAVTGPSRGQRIIQASDDGALEGCGSLRGLTMSVCGRWRTAGMSPPGLSVRC
jgi:hypothetical protein